MYPSQYYSNTADITDDDGDIGCSHCGALSFIYAKGSTSLCESCAEEVEAEIDSRGGIDKCMNCGRYKYGDQLNRYQVCSKGCVNPNEY
jgi:hypothetical protein